jgi:capsular polysaccharide biosynthesis protein
MYELQQIDLAATVTEPVSPDHFQNAVLSALMGFMFGVGSVLLREYLIHFMPPRQDQSSDAPAIVAPNNTVAYEQ